MTTYEPGLASTNGAELSAERDRSYRGGMLIFLISESMFFVSLLASRFVLAGSGHPAGLEQGTAGLLTIVVLVSLLPATAMGRAARAGDWATVQRWTGLTTLAGVVLLGGVAWEWTGLDIDPGSRFGGVFYLTIGMHALHVLIAVLLLLGVLGRTRAGRFTTRSHFGVEAGQLFWYLVAGLWVAVWAVFYLI